MEQITGPRLIKNKKKMNLLLGLRNHLILEKIILMYHRNFLKCKTQIALCGGIKYLYL